MDDLFTEVFGVITEQWRARSRDLDKLSRPQGEVGITWHSFERWLVWEAYFACYESPLGEKFNILPEPLYWYEAKDQKQAKKELKHTRADLLLRPKDAQPGARSVWLEFKLVQPGDNPTPVRELMHERKLKIMPAMRLSGCLGKYCQIVVIHRRKAMANGGENGKHKHPAIFAAWDRQLKSEEFAIETTIALDSDETTVHGIVVNDQGQ
jgi:hypothetical protein